MASVEEHYDQVFADVYSWMSGGWEAALARNIEFFAAHGIAPRKSAVAVDLGAGCGFQSIPLARLGFSVTAIDLDRKLLDELIEHAEDLEIDTIRAISRLSPSTRRRKSSSSSAWSTRCCTCRRKTR